MPASPLSRLGNLLGTDKSQRKVTRIDSPVFEILHQFLPHQYEGIGILVIPILSLRLCSVLQDNLRKSSVQSSRTNLTVQCKDHGSMQSCDHPKFRNGLDCICDVTFLSNIRFREFFDIFMQRIEQHQSCGINAHTPFQTYVIESIIFPRKISELLGVKPSASFNFEHSPKRNITNFFINLLVLSLRVHVLRVFFLGLFYVNSQIFESLGHVSSNKMTNNDTSVKIRHEPIKWVHWTKYPPLVLLVDTSYMDAGSMQGLLQGRNHGQTKTVESYDILQKSELFLWTCTSSYHASSIGRSYKVATLYTTAFAAYT